MALLGVAIAIPEPYGEELRAARVRLCDPLAGAIPTHVTLLPPTEVDGSDLPKVDLHLEDIAASIAPFEMRLAGTGSFRPVSPVVFVRVTAGRTECQNIEVAVRSGPLARDPVFPYHPHVTVAHDLTEQMLDEAANELARYEARFDVTSFSRYRHGADGVWRPERTYRFGRSSQHRSA